MDRLLDITSPFRLDFAKTEIVGDGAEMIDCYARHRAVALADAFSPGFWSMVTNLARRSTFIRDSKTDVARRERESPASAGALIGMALSRPPLARWLADRLDAPSITGFASGGIFRNWPSDEDFLNWHDDVSPPAGTARRRIALTLGMSTEPHDGGDFHLRRRHGSEELASHRHDQAGSILLFEVDPSLEHRVAPLTSGGPRTTYLGWFVAAN